MNDDRNVGHSDKAVRLIDYLLCLASLKTKTTRNVDEYERVLWLSDIPQQKGCFCRAWGVNDEYDLDIWIEVQGKSEPKFPEVPRQFVEWINIDNIRNNKTLGKLPDQITITIPNPHWTEDSELPQFIQQIKDIGDYPNLQIGWDQYQNEKMTPWIEVHNSWGSVNKSYSSLFSIWQEQQKLGEEYELVLGLGLLLWKAPDGQRIRRHLIVANAVLEFESRLARFTVRSNPEGSKVRPELSMLDFEFQSKNGEDLAKTVLASSDDDPWDRINIESALQTLVHLLDSNGEYSDILYGKDTQIYDRPAVVYSPALILRKRTEKGLTDALCKIKNKIIAGEAIPSEFKDIIEIKSPSEGYTETIEKKVVDCVEEEILFPKASNEEQRRIVQKIKLSNGVLVQGPPGTGKSHTIANLVCHLLADGQRILITAKTPRALQVLLGKPGEKDDTGLIPRDVKPLCISLLGSGLDEKKSLEASVGGILHQSEYWNDEKAKREQTELKKSLQKLREEKTELEKRLKAIRESETFSHCVGNGIYRGTTARIVENLNADARNYEWFEDDVSVDKGYTIQEHIIRSLLQLLRYFSYEKKEELNLRWQEELLSADKITELFEQEKRDIEEEELLKPKADSQIAYSLANSNDISIQMAINSLLVFKNEYQKLLATHYNWVPRAIKDVIGVNKACWLELCRKSREAITVIGRLATIADNVRIDLSQQVDFKTIIEDTRIIRAHLQSGGSLGWWLFRPSVVKQREYLLKYVKVNGRVCSHIGHFVALHDALYFRTELEKIWSHWADHIEKPGGNYTVQFQALKSLTTVLESVLAFESITEKCEMSMANITDVTVRDCLDINKLDVFISSLKLATISIRKKNTARKLQDIEKRLLISSALDNAHPVLAKLAQSVKIRDSQQYLKAMGIVEALNAELARLKTMEEYLGMLRDAAPKLSVDLVLSANDPYWDERIILLEKAWYWKQTKSWVEVYIRKEDAPSIATRVRQIEEEISELLARLASICAWIHCLGRLNESHKRNMVAWEQNFGKIRKSGKGKQDYVHRREAQKNLNNCRDAIPAWVMPLHRIWDTVDPAPGMFDIIIVDEASQCGFEALPLFYIGKKILIVGDAKQISPSAEGIPLDPVTQLISKYLSDYEHKLSFNVNRSLFDQGELRYSNSKIILREHFRCMPEIIRFSNNLCYSTTPLIPLRQYGPERLQPLEHNYVTNGYREGQYSRAINRPEAEAVTNKIVDLCKDPKYQGKTMGVIVLQGEAQGGLIESLLLESMGAEEMSKRRLICGNPYSFQGDERDIIFLSMVAAPNERIGPFVKPEDEQRFNVAASRARDQMWLFHSVKVEDLSASDLRRKLLEYFLYQSDVGPPSLDKEELERRARQDNRAIIKPPKPFESWFEVDVALELLRRRYRITPQFEVAGKFIDIVIEGGQARLALECDGDRWHGPEKYDEDMQRQRQLERCGWEFFRVRECEYYSNPEFALHGLWQLLEERGIYPNPTKCQGPNNEEPFKSDKNGEEFDNEDMGGANNEESTSQNAGIQVGDRITYVHKDKPDDEKQVTITFAPSNPEWGMVNINTPIAQALLGASINEEVEAKLPTGCKIFIIKEIVKPQ